MTQFFTFFHFFRLRIERKLAKKVRREPFTQKAFNKARFSINTFLFCLSLEDNFIDK